MAATKDRAVLPGTIRLVQESWQAYKRHFRSYWPLYLIIGLNSGLSSFIRDLHQTVAPLPTAVEMLLTIFFAAVGFYISTIFIISLHKKQKNITLLDANKIEKAWMYFLAVLCSSLITVAGLVLLIVPGILWGIWYMFTSFIVLTENLGIGASLKKSKAYVRGYFWAVLQRVVLMWLLYIVIYLVIGTIIGTFVQPLGTIPPLVLSVISSLLLIPFSGLLSPLTLIYQYQLLSHLKTFHRK